MSCNTDRKERGPVLRVGRKQQFRSIQQAVNAASRQSGLVRIKVDPGIYNEIVCVRNNASQDTDFIIKGDSRKIVGMAFTQGAPWNLKNYQLSILGGGSYDNNTYSNANITVTQFGQLCTLTVTNTTVATNPNFVQAGVVEGDRITLRTVNGLSVLYTSYRVLGVQGNSITIFGSPNIPFPTPDGLSFAVEPNVQVLGFRVCSPATIIGFDIRPNLPNIDPTIGLLVESGKSFFGFNNLIVGGSRGVVLRSGSTYVNRDSYWGFASSFTAYNQLSVGLEVSSGSSMLEGYYTILGENNIAGILANENGDLNTEGAVLSSGNNFIAAINLESNAKLTSNGLTWILLSNSGNGVSSNNSNFRFGDLYIIGEGLNGLLATGSQGYIDRFTFISSRFASTALVADLASNITVAALGDISVQSGTVFASRRTSTLNLPTYGLFDIIPNIVVGSPGVLYEADLNSTIVAGYLSNLAADTTGTTLVRASNQSSVSLSSAGFGPTLGGWGLLFDLSGQSRVNAINPNLAANQAFNVTGQSLLNVTGGSILANAIQSVVANFSVVTFTDVSGDIGPVTEINGGVFNNF